MGRRIAAWLTVLLMLSSCKAGGLRRTSGSSDAELQASILALSDQLATAISRRDPEAAAHGVRDDDHVVYVSDGEVIRGREFRDVLRRFYAGMKRIDFRWDRREVKPVGDGGGVVTGWASISLVDQAGASSTDKAMFTLVYEYSAGSWEMVTAHKTTVR